MLINLIQQTGQGGYLQSIKYGNLRVRIEIFNTRGKQGVKYNLRND